MMMGRPRVNGSFTPILPAMLRALFVATSAAILFGCGGNAPPAPPPTEEAARIECDRFAARAIQTGEPADAARLSSRAADCYAALDSLPE